MLINKRKQITILGSGESGVGAAILSKEKGYDVWVSDKGKISNKNKSLFAKYGIGYSEGGHDEKKIFNAHEVIKSPGINPNQDLIKKIKSMDIPLTAEIEFAARFSKMFTIGVTGTNGKSTAATLLFQTMKKSGMSVELAGNIGKSFSRVVLKPHITHVVLEISSFMLDDIKSFQPTLSILLNISPDHLDRYGDMQAYIKSKMQIIKRMKVGDMLIFNGDDKTISNEIKNKIDKKNKIYNFSQSGNRNCTSFLNLKTKEMIIKGFDEYLSIALDDIPLTKIHNANNYMAAAIASKVLNIKNPDIRQSFSDFKGMPHRLEYIATIRGIRYVNDSKATNINATWYALEVTHGKIILLLGGLDKGNDYKAIKELIKQKVQCIICIGKDNSNIHESLSDTGIKIMDAKSLKEAIKTSQRNAQQGDTVLLSPACSSLDKFKNYQQRGHQFKKAVLNA